MISGRFRQRKLASTALVCGILWAQPAAAQAPTRDELRGVESQPTDIQPRLDISGGVERSPCPLADPRYADITVTITEVDFNNLKGVSPAELEPAWRPFAGTAQPIAALCEVRDAAATILRNKGYLAAVEVPTQRIEDGRVAMEVLYARVTAIRARGQTRGAEAKLEQYLSALSRDEVFNRFRAERYLLLARDLPGYNVQLTLRPAGTGPGDLIGEVTVLREPFALDFTLQNYAAPATGRWGGQLRAQAFGLTGMGDATSLSYYATADFKEQHILQGAHELRPGGEGLVVGAQATYAWTRPDLGTPGPGIEAETLFASAFARYPVTRTQGSNLWLGGGFDLIDQDVELIVPLSRDRLRVFWARVDYDAVDLSRRLPGWRAGASLELRQGVSGLGASDVCSGGVCAAGITPPSRTDGRVDATVLRGQATAEIRIGETTALVLQPRAQYASDRTLAFEEFTIGNYTIGRGYEPGTLTGDDGVGVRSELRGPRLPFGNDRFAAQPYLFGDAAWVWDKGLGGSQDAYSAGGGARIAWGDRMSADIVLAVPLERAGLAPRRDVRFLMTLTTRLLPWRD